MSGDISQWLNAAARAPLLTPAEEIHLAQLVQQSMRDDVTPGQRRAGARARHRMITANLRLVASVSRKFLPQLQRCRGIEHLDLLQEGTIGLNRAVDKFDPERGYKFSTYATLWLRQAMGRLLQVQGGMVYLPSGTNALLTKAYFAPVEARRSRETLRAYLGATDGEMNRLDDALLVANVGSLDAAATNGEDCGVTLGDLIADPNSQPSLEQLDREIAIAAIEAAGTDELALVQLNVEGISAKKLGELQDQSAVKTLRQLELARQRLAAIAAGHRNLVAA